MCQQQMDSCSTFCVVYRDGVSPRPRASVHSRVTMHRTPFFFAHTVTCRGASGFAFGAGAKRSEMRDPKKAVVRACMVLYVI